jgi:hypothetical protein
MTGIAEWEAGGEAEGGETEGAASGGERAEEEAFGGPVRDWGADFSLFSGSGTRRQEDCAVRLRAKVTRVGVRAKERVRGAPGGRGMERDYSNWG